MPDRIGVQATHPPSNGPSLTRGTRVACVLAWVTALAVATILEGWRVRQRLIHIATVGRWAGDPDPDGTYMLVWLMLAPFCWCFRCPWPAFFKLSPELQRHFQGQLFASLLVAAIAWGAIAGTAWRAVSQVPGAPAYASRVPTIHDEFSYLLQARTILAGRWSWDGPPVAPELFHQMHVLNDSRFASRYLPGTGVWIAPWLAWGVPHWGHWLAHIIVSVGVLHIGRSISGAGCGLIAGVLTAISPGMVLFGNLLLAHHPTLVGLTLFLWSFLCLMRQPRLGTAGLAGLGLAFAMLCRPLTAAAIGLPYGLWWVWQGVLALRHRGGLMSITGGDWLRLSAAMGLPLLTGFLIVGWQNQSLTGSVWQTPYSRYNELYTPFQRYGFHNRSSDGTPFSASVLEEYNDWARNLDGQLAVENGIQRIRRSLEWTLGLIPLLMTVVLAAGTCLRQPRDLQLLLLAIISLHVWHLPYWLDGMLGYHYVFESGPLLLLLLGAVSTELLRVAFLEKRALFPMWWGGLIVLAVAVNHVPVGWGTTTPRVHHGMFQLTHAADRYQRFEEALRKSIVQTPALILVRTSPGDLHVEYVRNVPPFDAEVLVGVDRRNLYDYETLQQLFPERTLYLYDSDRGDIQSFRESPHEMPSDTAGVP